MKRFLLFGLIALALAGCEKKSVERLPEGNESTTDRGKIEPYFMGRVGCKLPDAARNHFKECDWGHGERRETVVFEVADKSALEAFFYELVDTLQERHRPTNEDLRLVLSGVGGYEKWRDISFAQQDIYEFQYGGERFGWMTSITISKRKGIVKYFHETW
ncbi:MAG: hypothetical protein R3F11_33260 [Verrucomicrobiales bacterium]